MFQTASLHPIPRLRNQSVRFDRKHTLAGGEFEFTADMKVQTACFRCGEIDMNLTAFWQGKCQVGERAGNVDVGDCARQHGVLDVGFPFVQADVADRVLFLPAVLSIQRPAL